MKKKTIFVVILIAVIVFVAGYFWQATHRLSELKYYVQKITLGNEKEKFTIDAEYPVISSGIPTQAKEKINEDLKKWVDDSVSKAKTDFSDLLNDPMLTRSNLGLTYAGKTTIKNDFQKLPYINVSIETYYYSGGAHGITDISTFVYDANTGDKLSLGNVFTISKDFYGTLSKLSLEAIKEKDPNLETYSFAEEGTSPDPNNFQMWTLNPDGLHIIFSDYQVGSYVAGRPEIVISYNKLGNFIIDRNPLYLLIH